MADTLLVCSTGGHLSEMWDIRDRIEPRASFVWAVPENAQSASMLADQRWVRIPYFGARDWRAALRSVPYARRLLRQHAIDRVVSTGGSVVTPYMVAAGSLRIPRFYIETVARTSGPSLTGRFASLNPGTHLFTQHESWAGGRWRFIGSVFDRFSAAPESVQPPGVLNVVVTLGTNPFPFDRAVRAIHRVLPPDSHVVWQVGPGTDTSLVPGSRDLIPAADLQRAISSADVVVAHAGAGSALAALEAGRQPILVPRLARYNEMIDDHQLLIGESLSRRGLAQAVDAEQLTTEHIRAAAVRRVVQVEPPVMQLAT